MSKHFTQLILMSTVTYYDKCDTIGTIEVKSAVYIVALVVLFHMVLVEYLSFMSKKSVGM